MRTSLNIDSQLLEAAQKRAQSRGTTVESYVEEALRRRLAAPDKMPPPPEIPIFTRGTGMRDGLDGDSTRSLFDALDGRGDLP